MITVLTGSNAYALQQQLKKLKQDFTQAYGEAGIENYQAEQLELETIANLLTGATLFSQNRLVIIRSLSEVKELTEAFLTLLKTIPDSIHVVLLEPRIDKRTLFYKTLTKEAQVKELSELNEYSAIKWVKDYVEGSQGVVRAGAVEMLVRYVGTNQQRLESEIQKLLAYSNTIDKESIDLLVEKQSEETVFQLLELALGGKSQQALEVLDNLERAHEDPHQIANMLIWQAQVVAIVVVAGTKSDSEIAKESRLNPFVVKKTRALSRSMNRDRLRTILDVLARLDTDLKSSKAEPWRLLEVAILKL